MKTPLTTLLSFILLTTTIAQNTATPIWSAAFGLQDTVLKIPTAVDLQKNLYIAGSTIDNSTGPDILLAKYDQYGNPLWTANYTGTGYHRDQASAIAIDNNYNIILGGFTYSSSTNNYDYLVLKYDSAGTLLWTYTYNGTGSAADIISAITTSGRDIYITGASIGSLSGFDYTTIKLNSSGTVIWNNRYNYFGNDLPFDIDISGTNVFVNGGSQSTITDWDYAQIIYTTSGTPFDTIRTTGTGVGFDHAAQAVTDVQGYVYITGAFATTSNGLDFKTIKLDQQGNIKWISTFDGLSHQDDQANSVGVDYYGNVYVTGQTKNSSGNTDYCTIKYDSLGTQEWIRYYNYNHDDKANKLIVGDDNNIYITGESSNGSNKDFATIAYNIYGDTLWQIRFNGAYNNDDMATNIAKDGDFVYVSGQSKINATTYQYITIAYGEATFEEIPDAFNEPTGNTWYYPNNGQLANDSGNVVSNISFYSQNQSPAIYFDNYSTSYVFSHIDNDSTTIDTIQRVDMNFIKDIPLVPIPGGIPVPGAMLYPDEIYSVGKADKHYLNFYLPHCANGVTEVYGYKNLFREEIYKGIDVYYSSNEGGLKHYFVIKKTNPYQIVMRFMGADSISHSSGTYSIHTSIGTLKYDTLVAYELDASGTIIPNTMQPLDIYADTAKGYWHFVPFTYNTSNTLVIMAKQKVFQSQGSASIDNLLWSSFIGGSNSTNLNAVKNDIDGGNVYFTGNTTGENFPVTSGISVPPLSGYKDAILIKLSNDVELVWISYLGGTIDATNNSDNDNAIALAVSESGDRVYIAGITTSEDMPIENDGGNYFSDPSNSNCSDDYDCSDAFFARFDVNGFLQWSTYFGSNGPEAIYSLALDGDNNLFAVD